MRIAKIAGFGNLYYKSSFLKNNKNFQKNISFQKFGIKDNQDAASIKPYRTNIDEFRKEGEFKEGKTVYRNKPYNGTIIVENKNGVYELEYQNGELKTSTLFSVNKLSPEAQLAAPFEKKAMNKKVYINNPDEKIIEKYSLGASGLKYVPYLSEKTTIRKDKITHETQGLYEPTVKISQKQKDGSWRTLLREVYIGSGFEAYRFTIDLNSNQIIEKKSLGTKIPNLYSEPVYNAFYN